jgi:hypothetical protein
MKLARISSSLFCKCLSALALSAVAISFQASAASILWVSDNTTEGSGFTAVPASSESAWFNLLTGAGNTLTHYNPPNTGPMSASDVATLNTFNLIIIGRSIGSGAFQGAASGTPQWNTAITAPVMTINGYLVRNSRLGWFGGEDVPDGSPTPVTASNLSDPETAYIFSGVSMTGSTTSGNYDEPVGRNTSQINAAIVGGTRLASATFQPLGRTTNVTTTVIGEWQQGALVRGGTDPLAGYRMYFAAGSREPSGGSVPQAGVENLTATGERMFLNSVTIALNAGVVPEPGTMSLAALGLAGIAAWGWRKKNSR